MNHGAAATARVVIPEPANAWIQEASTVAASRGLHREDSAREFSTHVCFLFLCILFLCCFLRNFGCGSACRLLLCNRCYRTTGKKFQGI
jgi:hypothetical protein